MPRIDRDVRDRAVYDAAIALLSRGGYGALTLRGLADALGGSMTLVTHYFPTQSDLMHGVLEYQLALFDEELAPPVDTTDPRAHLRALVEWFLPVDDESWNQERARVLLAIHTGTQNTWMRPHLDRVESKMRELLASRLEPLVAPVDLPLAVDTLRMLLSGVVLSAVEHREHWSADRQREVVDRVWPILPWKETGAPAA